MLSAAKGESVTLGLVGPADCALNDEKPPRHIAPLPAGELAKRLREATPAILDLLGGNPPGVLHWRFDTKDETTTEWNRSELGPSTESVWTLVADIFGVEAAVRCEIIRWSPSDIQCTEVLAHWRTAARVVTFFARGEGVSPISEVRTDDIVWRSVRGLGLLAPAR